MENKDKFESDYATDVKTDQVSFFVIANNFVKRTPTLVVRELSFEPKLAFIILKMTAYFRSQ